MAARYRLTRIEPSNNPNSVKEARSRISQRSHPLDHGYDVQPTVITKPASRHVGLWIALGFLALLLIVGAAIWMTGVSGDLSHIQQTTQQNANTIQQTKGLLVSIQAQIHAIDQQISQLSQQITTLFGDLIRAIHSSRP